MKKVLLLVLSIHLLSSAAMISENLATKIAKNFISQEGLNLGEVVKIEKIEDAQSLLAYVAQFHDNGFVVVSADDQLKPIIAFSSLNRFSLSSPLADIIKSDLTKRVKYIEKQDIEIRSRDQSEWAQLLDGEIEKGKDQQWPPAGSTTTGGWTITKWNQSYPYNIFCPMDNGSRSLTGCPSTAMAQILVYLKTVNGTTFDSSDRYLHNYTHNYWVDDAHEEYQFLTFDEINVYLDTIQAKLSSNRDFDFEDKAALSLACGFACRSVYSSGGSGTFGVDQARDAFIKFGFKDLAFLDASSSDDEIREKMIENIKDGYPVHLATVNEAWNSGHNVVCDGYRDDGYFRLNMGWGGSSDGWYSLPEGFPLNLTVFEGIVADIKPENLLKQPESVEYYAEEDIYLVSNWESGEIVAIDQNNIHSNFNSELTSVAGIKIYNDKLYCCDRNGLGIIDLESRVLETVINLDGDSLVNDLLFYNNHIFVSDYWDPKIYKINLDDHSSEILVEENNFVPNGLHLDEENGRILAVARDNNGLNPRVVSIDPESGERSILLHTSPYFSLDGITQDSDGNYYISSWHLGNNSTHGVIKYDQNFENPEILTTDCNGPADIFIRGNILAIPNLISNSVDFIELEINNSVDEPNRISAYSLYQNYPNPFNPTTTINYQTTKEGVINLSVYNGNGELVKELVKSNHKPGYYSVEFDGTDLSSGIYYYSIKGSSFSSTKKMILIK